MSESGQYYIGLMSGTSLDGVDAALVDFSDGSIKCIATAYVAYTDDLRQELLSLHFAGQDDLHRSSLLSNQLAGLYAEAALAALGTRPPSAVRAIGCHGQTVRHAPEQGYTIQLGNSARLAELTGISVVADFRSRDIAAGGQGAPLVPAFHDFVFRAPDSSRVVVNIGGIANITHLGRGAPVTGFDCGPGNMLLDAWVKLHLGKAYDENGDWARGGQVIDKLLSRLLSHEYFSAAPPKSCGREQFNLAWLLDNLDGTEAPIDVETTLSRLTASSIATAIGRWCSRPDELFVCGGGARNAFLLGTLKKLLPETRVAKTDVLGLPADWVEAVAFAWLARQALLGLTGNLPKVTGASGRRILGAIYPA